MPWATSRAAPASNWHSFGIFPWSEPSNDLHARVASPGSRRATDRIRTGVRCRRAKRERLLVTPVRKRCPSWIAYRPGPSQSGQANSNSSGVAIQRMSFTITEQNRASTLLIRCLARGRSAGLVAHKAGSSRDRKDNRGRQHKTTHAALRHHHRGTRASPWQSAQYGAAWRMGWWTVPAAAKNNGEP